MVDRLMHHSEVIAIEGESFRLKEAQEEDMLRKKARAGRRVKKAE